MRGPAAGALAGPRPGPRRRGPVNHPASVSKTVSPGSAASSGVARSVRVSHDRAGPNPGP
eukprot:362837-Hanusia_phi.AAC.1